jgi:2-dehydro-3-deoxygluconokinase
VLVSFDVNYRPALWPVSVAAAMIRRLAAGADVVFVGLDEANVLWDCRRAEELRAVLPDVERIVIKDGAVEAVELGPDGRVVVPTRPTPVVEVVGAGDAFAAGYLAGLLEGRPAADRILLGHRRAAVALAGTGDFPRVERVQGR